MADTPKNLVDFLAQRIPHRRELLEHYFWEELTREHTTPEHAGYLARLKDTLQRSGFLALGLDPDQLSDALFEELTRDPAYDPVYQQAAKAAMRRAKKRQMQTILEEGIVEGLIETDGQGRYRLLSPDTD